jgi:hypothetical protein
MFAAGYPNAGVPLGLADRAKPASTGSGSLVTAVARPRGPARVGAASRGGQAASPPKPGRMQGRDAALLSRHRAPLNSPPDIPGQLRGYRPSSDGLTGVGTVASSPAAGRREPPAYPAPRPTGSPAEVAGMPVPPDAALVPRVSNANATLGAPGRRVCALASNSIKRSPSSGQKS